MGEARRRALSRVREVLPPVLADPDVGMPAPHNRWGKDGLVRHLREALANVRALAAPSLWADYQRRRRADAARKLIPDLERALVYVAQLNAGDAVQLMDELAVWEVLES